MNLGGPFAWVDGSIMAAWLILMMRCKVSINAWQEIWMKMTFFRNEEYFRICQALKKNGQNRGKSLISFENEIWFAWKRWLSPSDTISYGLKGSSCKLMDLVYFVWHTTIQNYPVCKHSLHICRLCLYQYNQPEGSDKPHSWIHYITESKSNPLAAPVD